MGQLIQAPDLAWMRTMQQRAMPGTVIIERSTLTADSLGGFTEAWGAVGTAIGRVYPQNTRTFGEPVMGERLTSEGRWFATFPVGTDILASDRLSYGGRSFEVIRVNNDEMLQTAVRAECVTHNEEDRV